MKRFIIQVLCIAIPCLAFLGWIEWRLRSMPNDYTYKKAFLDERSDEIEHLILGSSLSWRGINPQLIGPNSYNAAFSGQSLKYDSFLLSKYKEQLTSLENVILTIFYPTFEFERNELLGNIEKYYSVYFDFGPPTVLFNLYNGVQIRKQFHKYAQDPNAFIHSDPLGFRSEVAPLVGTLQANAEKMAHFHTADFPKVRENNLDHLRTIVDMCASMNAHLYLVLYPANEWYRKHLDEQQIERMRTLTSGFKGEKVQVLDYFESNEFDDSDFFDGIHLNSKGAEQLSQLISKEINKE